MARDLAEMEREFIDSLAADTGQDLAGWMAAIGSSGRDNRNDIIDWLRQQGFAFPKASWLERIHHNGGRLIYEGEITVPIVPAATEVSPPPADAASDIATASNATVTPPANENRLSGHKASTQYAASDDAGLLQLLMSAKGLRPLAELILREIDAVVPGSRQRIAPPYIQVACPADYIALLPQPKAIRLYADFGSSTRDRTKKAEYARPLPPFPDVLVVDDARQVDERFREILASAYSRSLR